MLQDHQQHRAIAHGAGYAGPAMLQAEVEVCEGQLIRHLVQGQPIPPALQGSGKLGVGRVALHGTAAQGARLWGGPCLPSQTAGSARAT